MLGVQERLGTTLSTSSILVTTYVASGLVVSAVHKVGQQVEVISLAPLKEGRGPSLAGMNATNIEIRMTIRLPTVQSGPNGDRDLLIFEDLNLVCRI